MRYFLCFILLLALTGCASHPGQTKFTEYANTIPSIIVPAGIKNPTAESYYPIPPVVMVMPIGVKPPLAPPGSQLTVNTKTSLPKPQ